jgi:hypothetical protein
MKSYGLVQILHLYFMKIMSDENRQKCVMTVVYYRKKISGNIGSFGCNNYEEYCILRRDAV